ncbi:hypothetical protein ACXZ66_12520 [Corynebacterium sp. S7]
MSEILDLIVEQFTALLDALKGIVQLPSTIFENFSFSDLSSDPVDPDPVDPGTVDPSPEAPGTEDQGDK